MSLPPLKRQFAIGRKRKAELPKERIPYDATAPVKTASILAKQAANEAASHDSAFSFSTLHNDANKDNTNHNIHPIISQHTSRCSVCVFATDSKQLPQFPDNYQASEHAL